MNLSQLAKTSFITRSGPAKVHHRKQKATLGVGSGVGGVGDGGGRWGGDALMPSG